MAQQGIPVPLLRSGPRPQHGLGDNRAIVSEIDGIAVGIVAEVEPFGGRRPVPRLLDVVGDGPRRDLRALGPIDGTAAFLRMLCVAPGR